MKTILASVYGSIHGVGFKSYVQRCALKNNIKGYAQNEENGTITIKACGKHKDIKAFINMIESGNGFAIVDFLVIEVLTPETYSEFRIIY